MLHPSFRWPLFQEQSQKDSLLREERATSPLLLRVRYLLEALEGALGNVRLSFVFAPTPCLVLDRSDGEIHLLMPSHLPSPSTFSLEDWLTQIQQRVFP